LVATVQYHNLAALQQHQVAGDVEHCVPGRPTVAGKEPVPRASQRGYDASCGVHAPDYAGVRLSDKNIAGAVYHDGVGRPDSSSGGELAVTAVNTNTV
jgi:hypothetical protein